MGSSGGGVGCKRATTMTTKMAMMMGRGQVGVEVQYLTAKTSTCLDIENCRVPKGCDPQGIAQNISLTLMTMNYSNPVSISSYGDTNRILASVQHVIFNTRIAINHVPVGILPLSTSKP